MLKNDANLLNTLLLQFKNETVNVVQLYEQKDGFLIPTSRIEFKNYSDIRDWTRSKGRNITYSAVFLAEDKGDKLERFGFKSPAFAVIYNDFKSSLRKQSYYQSFKGEDREPRVNLNSPSLKKAISDFVKVFSF